MISDRFLDSTWAYQGTAGVPGDVLARLDAIAVGESRPDLTLILDLPVDAGLARMQKRDRAPDRFEADALQLHEARRTAYLAIAERRADALRGHRCERRRGRGRACHLRGG